MNRHLPRSRHFETHPIDAALPFGAIVNGLHPSQLEDSEVQSDLKALWTESGVIVFRGLEGKETQLALSEVFGELVAHPVKEVAIEDKMLVTIPYRPEAGLIVDVAGEERGLAQSWHSDLIYSPKVNRGGILRPIQIPSRWGETGFIDKIWAYETLRTDIKERIEGLHVVYRYDVDPSHQRFGVQREMRFVRMTPLHMSIQARLHEFPAVIHPLVFTQAETGRKVLNLSPWFATGIMEIPTAEGDALLETIARHVVDGGHAYVHSWSMDEMVLFDNWRMLHAGFGSPVDEVRIMQRTNIAGDYGLGRLKPDAVEGASDYAIL